MEPNPLVHFIPLIIGGLLFAVFGYFMAVRKGKSPLYALLCFIPFIGPFVLLWLISLTDKSVLDRLAALEGRTTHG